MLIVLLSIGLILSIVLNIFLYKSLRVQLNKVSLYEEWIGEYEAWIQNVRDIISTTYLSMKRVDDKNLFSKDDDVGFIFSELLSLLKQLNDKIRK